MQSSVEPISFVANLGQFSWKLSLLRLQCGRSWPPVYMAGQKGACHRLLNAESPCLASVCQLS